MLLSEPTQVHEKSFLRRVQECCPPHPKRYLAFNLSGPASPTQEDPPLPPPGNDPFVSIMLAIPRLLARRSSCDEPLQLHSIAYLATANTYCRLRMAMGVPGWSSNPAGESPRGFGALVSIFFRV